MTAEETMKSMMAAANEIRQQDDNLLRAIAALAAGRHIQIVPTSSLFGMDAKPVICLPQRMYDRLSELFPPAPPKPPQPERIIGGADHG
jgi:hypothetical protein